MSAETDLLPCPWCGEKLASVSVSEGSTFRWRKVDGCCADGPEVRHNTMADDQEAAEVESRTAAIAAWNRRANLAELQREVEGLRAEVAEWKAVAKWEGEQHDSAFHEARTLNARAERLAGACRVAVLALAHASETDAKYFPAYEHVSAALEQETTNG